jgi:hypothetical protein
VCFVLGSVIGAYINFLVFTALTIFLFIFLFTEFSRSVDMLMKVLFAGMLGPPFACFVIGMYGTYIYYEHNTIASYVSGFMKQYILRS